MLHHLCYSRTCDTMLHPCTLCSHIVPLYSCAPHGKCAGSLSPTTSEKLLFPSLFLTSDFAIFEPHLLKAFNQFAFPVQILDLLDTLVENSPYNSNKYLQMCHFLGQSIPDTSPRKKPWCISLFHVYLTSSLGHIEWGSWECAFP